MILPQTLIISGFTLTGKTWVFKHRNTFLNIAGLNIFRYYPWKFTIDGRNTGEPNPNFPVNYMDDIRFLVNLAEYDIVLIYPNARIINFLRRRIDLVMVYPRPDKDTKELWLEKYDNRENNNLSRKFIEDNYESMIQRGINFAADNNKNIYFLDRKKPNLSDILEDIIEDMYHKPLLNFVYPIY